MELVYYSDPHVMGEDEACAEQEEDDAFVVVLRPRSLVPPTLRGTTVTLESRCGASPASTAELAAGRGGTA